MFKNQLLSITYLLVCIGTVFISTASLFEAQTNLDNQYFFLQKQLIWLVIGSASCLIASRVDLKLFKKMSPFFYIVSVVALSLVYLPQFGHKVFGARRWLNIGPLRFQPTEVFKISSLLFFSRLFSNKQKINLKNLAFYALIPLGLILFEPDLSSAFLVGSIIFAIYFF
jgi:cell division protein FtsW